MASCTGSPPSPIPLEPPRIESLAQEVHKCVKKDQLVKAKFLLKVISLRAELRKRQECIPVGCVPSVAVAVWGGGDVCL